MGYNTTVVVHNDALNDIARDQESGKNLSEATKSLTGRTKPVPVPSGCRVNAARAIETHLADDYKAIVIGGNTGIDVGLADDHTIDIRAKEGRLRLLKALAANAGYRFVKKAAKKTEDSHVQETDT